MFLQGLEEDQIILEYQSYTINAVWLPTVPTGLKQNIIISQQIVCSLQYTSRRNFWSLEPSPVISKAISIMIMPFSTWLIDLGKKWDLRLMTTSEKISLKDPAIFMVVFSHEKEEDSVKKQFSNRRKTFAIYKRFDSRKHKFSNISKSSSFMYLENSSKP